MKHLLNFIFESDDLKDLKTHIKKEVDQTDEAHEKLLVKVDKMLNQRGLSREVFEKTLDKNGLSFCYKALLRTIDYYDSVPEFIQMYNDPDSMIKTETLLENNDIYELFNNVNNIKFDKDLIKELAFTELSSKNISKGKFEILSQLFLSDINEGNKNYDGKSGDINAGGYALEYKLSGARIQGQGTLENPKEIYRELKKLLLDITNKDNISKLQKEQSSLIRFYKDDELEKELDAIESDISNLEGIFKLIDSYDCLKTEQKYNEFINELSKLNISDDLINGILASAILKQIPDNKFKISKDDESNFIEFVKNPKNAPVVKSKPIVKNLKTVFGAFQMWLYQHIENFDKMVIFKKKGKVASGKYIVIDRNEFKDFESIKTAMEDKNVEVESLPGINEPRSYAIVIRCNK